MKKQSIFVLAGIGVILIGGMALIWQKKTDQKSSNFQKSLSSENQSQAFDLVWYDVPELGIRFKVTPDTKNDLRYVVSVSKSIKEPTLFFYSQSIFDFNSMNGRIPCSIRGYGADEDFFGQTTACSDFALSRYSIKGDSGDDSKHGCENSVEKARVGDDSICYTYAQATSFSSKNEYDEYQESVKYKRFGIFWDTVEPIR